MEPDVETFMSVTGGSRSEAVEILRAHEGDLNSALDSYFSERDKNVSKSKHEGASHANRENESGPRVYHYNERPSIFMHDFWRPFSRFDELRKNFFHGTSIFESNNSLERLTHSRSIPFDWNDNQPEGNVAGISAGRNFMPDTGGPQISHPKDVRVIDIEWKDKAGETSRAAHEPLIEEIPEEEYGGYEPGLEGHVTVLDDDSPRGFSTSVKEFNSQPKRHRFPTSSGPTITEVSDAPYMLDNIEEQILKTAIEESVKEVESNWKQHYDLTTDGFIAEADRGDRRVCGEKYLCEDGFVAEADRSDRREDASSPETGHPIEDENAVCFHIRMPDGQSLRANFNISDKLELLFKFIEKHTNIETGSYRLVRHCPRQVLNVEEGERPFTTLGLEGKQEALFLELC